MWICGTTVDARNPAPGNLRAVTYALGTAPHSVTVGKYLHYTAIVAYSLNRAPNIDCDRVGAVPSNVSSSLLTQAWQ